MCCHQKCLKMLVGFIILIAIVLAIAVNFLNQQSMQYVGYIGRFFEIMIPILGVGALLKYLLGSCCCGYAAHKCHQHSETLTPEGTQSSCSCGEKKE
jgi:hypothetical protein